MGGKSDYLTVIPDATLIFFGPFDHPKLTSLRLHNFTRHRIAFKFKTDVPLLYKVWPKTGFVEPNTQVLVEIALRAFDERCLYHAPLEHHFAIFAHPAAFDYIDPEDFWRVNELRPHRIQKKKIPVIIQPIDIKGRQMSLKQCCSSSHKIGSTSQLFYSPSMGAGAPMPGSLPSDWEDLHHAEQILIASRYSDSAQRIHAENTRGEERFQNYAAQSPELSPRPPVSPPATSPRPSPRAEEARHWLFSSPRAQSLLMIKEESVDVGREEDEEEGDESWLRRTVRSSHRYFSSLKNGQRPKSEPNLAYDQTQAHTRAEEEGLRREEERVLEEVSRVERRTTKRTTTTESVQLRPPPPYKPQPTPRAHALPPARYADDAGTFATPAQALSARQLAHEKLHPLSISTSTLPASFGGSYAASLSSPLRRRPSLGSSPASFDSAGVRRALRKRVSYLEELGERERTGSRLRPLAYRDYQSVMWDTARYASSRASSRSLASPASSLSPATRFYATVEVGAHSSLWSPVRSGEQQQQSVTELTLRPETLNESI